MVVYEREYHKCSKVVCVCVCVCVCVMEDVVVQSLSHVQLFCDLMDCSLPGSSVHGIIQARILEWVARPSSRGSSQPRDQTQVLHCRQILYCLSQQEAQKQQAQYNHIFIKVQVGVCAYVCTFMKVQQKILIPCSFIISKGCLIQRNNSESSQMLEKQLYPLLPSVEECLSGECIPKAQQIWLSTFSSVSLCLWLINQRDF